MLRPAIASFVVTVCLASVAGADDNTPPDPIWVKSIVASSTFADKKDAYAAHLVLLPKVSYNKDGDERYDSAWCEGKKDAGLGEKLAITFARPTTIPELSLKAGVWMTPALFAANNQPTTITITTDDARTFTVKPTAKREDATVAIGGKPITTLTIAITEVKPGKMNDSCLSEVAFGESPIVIGFDDVAATAFAKTIPTFWAAFDKCDAAVLSKWMEFPFNYTWIENTHGTAGHIPHASIVKSAAALVKSCSLPAPDATVLNGAQISATKPNELRMGYDTADTSQTAVLVWKAGAWKLATIK